MHAEMCEYEKSYYISPCNTFMQERLAPSAVTHRILTVHPYNTRQQTGLAGQQLNIHEAMPECTPTENNCFCAQAVLELLTSCCSHKAAGMHRCSKHQYEDADLSSLKIKGGKQ